MNNIFLDENIEMEEKDYINENNIIDRDTNPKISKYHFYLFVKFLKFCLKYC